MNPKISVKTKEEFRLDKIRFKLKDDKLRIYAKDVRFEEIMHLVVTDVKKVKKQLLTNTISKVSWSAVAEAMESRSADDVRHQWNLKILPLFIPDQHVWTQ